VNVHDMPNLDRLSVDTVSSGSVWVDTTEVVGNSSIAKFTTSLNALAIMSIK